MMNTKEFVHILCFLTVSHLQCHVALDSCIAYDAKEYIPFDFTNDQLTNSTLTGTIVTSATVASLITGSAMLLTTSYVDLGFTQADRTMCLHSPDACGTGFSLHLALHLSADISSDKYYLSNGGQSDKSYGMSIGVIGSELTVRVTTVDQEWEVKDTNNVRVSGENGYFVGVTWDRSTLTLYESGVLIASSSAPVNRTSFLTIQNDFYFGKSTSATTTGAATYDEFIFWEDVKTGSFLQDLKTSQISSTCVVKCEDKPGDTDLFHSCYGCNLYWDCKTGTGQLMVCRSGYTFDASLKDCTATATSCPSTIIRDVITDEMACFPVPCSMDPCQNNGTCTDETDGWLCHCNVTAKGWEGDRCESNIDECLPSPCVNASTTECVDGVGGLNNYTCVCLAGYNLTHCENYNNCLDNPCENGAGCYDDVTADNFTCDCLPGYTGYNCSIDINECAVDPCENGATCNDLVNMYNCTCPPGYSGVHCEFYNDCYFDPCVNGTCMDVNQTVYGDYSCDCINGFLGRNCSDEQECVTQNVTCENGGTCMDLEGGWECECVPGFTNVTCETNINECAPDPCMNDANCTDLINDYTCSCVPGYTDKNCSTNFNECSSDPCQNGGACNDMVNEYNCSCPTGYSGTHCELYDECSIKPCNNGATCLDSDLAANQTHMCTCVDGYWGSDCASDNGCVTNSVNCDNGGTCDNTTVDGDYVCDCLPGYDGEFCGNNTNECASDPCQNGGVCHDQVNMYNCSCAEGFSDTHCSFEHKCQTQNVVCRNNGTCDDITGTCLCTVAYTGDTCQLDNPCLPNPCVYLEMESGTCNIIDNLANYNCSCDSGYSGQHCEVSPCSSAPCQNGGTCVLDGDSFNCACPDGFTGLLCQSDPTAGAQTGEESSSWRGTSIALIVILVVVIAVVVIVTVIVVYKYKHRNNKVGPDYDDEDPTVNEHKADEDPTIPFQNGGASGGGTDPWEGKDVQFEPSNEAAPATFDSGEGTTNGGVATGSAYAGAIPPKPKQPNPLDGPVVGGFSPPPKYDGPVPVETAAIESRA